MESSFSVLVSRGDPTHEVLVRVRGELDLATVERLRRAVSDALAPSTRRMVVDCTDLDFMDLTSARVLLAAHDELLARSGELVLRRPTAAVIRLLALLELDRGPRVEAD